MKKYFFIVLIFIGLISACEIDDICTDPTTPNLVLRFYDATSTSTLKVTDSLYIWAVGRTDSIFKNQVTDSIAIPLNPLTTEMVYNLSKGTLLLNKLTISYTVQEEYVSRSCGFRYVYSNVSLAIDAPTNKWISSITPNTVIPIINNQNSAHVQVFH